MQDEPSKLLLSIENIGYLQLSTSIDTRYLGKLESNFILI